MNTSVLKIECILPTKDKNDKYKKQVKTFHHVRPEVSDEDLTLVAQEMVKLLRYPIGTVERVNVVELTGFHTAPAPGEH